MSGLFLLFFFHLLHIRGNPPPDKKHQKAAAGAEDKHGLPAGQGDHQWGNKIHKDGAEAAAPGYPGSGNGVIFFC